MHCLTIRLDSWNMSTDLPKHNVIDGAGGSENLTRRVQISARGGGDRGDTFSGATSHGVNLE